MNVSSINFSNHYTALHCWGPRPIWDPECFPVISSLLALELTCCEFVGCFLFLTLSVILKTESLFTFDLRFFTVLVTAAFTCFPSRRTSVYLKYPSAEQNRFNFILAVPFVPLLHSLCSVLHAPVVLQCYLHPSVWYGRIVSPALYPFPHFCQNTCFQGHRWNFHRIIHNDFESPLLSVASLEPTRARAELLFYKRVQLISAEPRLPPFRAVALHGGSLPEKLTDVFVLFCIRKPCVTRPLLSTVASPARRPMEEAA